MNQTTTPVMTPTNLIQAQLEAYNAHDVERLLALYAPDARQHEYPDRLIAEGAEALRQRMTARFEPSRPRAELLHRIALGNTVIDHERIFNQTATGPVVRELIAIYEVDMSLPAAPGSAKGNGRIVGARFVFGEERPV